MKFESEKLENLFKIVGGQAQSTTFHSSTGATGCDTYEVVMMVFILTVQASVII